MKKFLLIPVTIVLLSGLIFGACAAPTPEAPAAGPAPVAPAEKPAPAKPAEVITLIYANQNPETGLDGTDGAGPWLDELEKAAKGKVVFERYWGQTLCKGTDTWEAIKRGLCDTGWCFFPWWPGMTPMSDVINLPGMPFKSSQQGATVIQTLYDEFPTIAAEYKDCYMMYLGGGTPYKLWTCDKQVIVPEDIKGLKIRVIGKAASDWLTSIHAVPQMIGMPEMYQALATGVVDGMGAPFEPVSTFRLYEHFKYRLDVCLYAGYEGHPMNWDAWNSVPADVKQAWKDAKLLGVVAGRARGKNWQDDMEAPLLKNMEEGGYTVTKHVPTAEETAAWNATAKPFWDEWVAKMTAAGHTEAQDILDRALELCASEPAYYPDTPDWGTW